ncbi:pirin family protein [Gilvimarinus agarilyticus]|uniref:pirin family protein n=1 Tax=Gilvimarinus sp. 2_MG-2023 TaxID=3062666 RepID=UPI001C09659C|nr:pirin family protein [Gilvimarinus sp. 2_MG-2023]MBU2887287.1 pirin family protein [Gilvimarinus agarilyticus]MDO6571946.1 pirin family protein [Gilvimarinus sp. 2_MG-2023]
MKSIASIIKAPSSHWVGNGFPVRSLFSYHNQGSQMSPFLLLDYAGPMLFPADGQKRGVGEHPHRGFETVTIVYQGEVEHRDSTGQGGIIGPGDVQWMTAGAGILHEEFHSNAFSQKGGNLQMVQLWVNLPQKHKMTQPGYQSITKADIPTVELANNAGQLRPIAGQFEGHQGPADTFSQMQVWDLQLNAGGKALLDLPDGWTTAVVILQGEVSVNGSEPLSEGSLVSLERKETEVTLHASQNSLVLLLSGEPINEPIVGHGPFVMNTKQEILQAFDDLQRGQFGSL